MSNIIEIKNVTKSYGKTRALSNISLDIASSKIIGLLGPNGSGKTTLLKLFLHILRPDNGIININGESVSYLTRKYISYMPDREYLYDNMTIKEAIKYYVDMFEDFDIEKSKVLCNKLGLNVSDRISKLSKGNVEKVNLMLTLSRNTAIYLLDEPLGSLDPVIKHEMLSVIKEAKKANNVIIIATHLIKDTEEILDSAIFLKNGEIKLFEDLDTLLKDNKTLSDYYLEVFSNV